MTHKDFMEKAIALSAQNVSLKKGGPFGAVIVKDGQIIAGSCNQVLQNNDPTAHAEVSAIRKACETLGTFDLSDCDLYTSCEPCPMCLMASKWANIRRIYYAATRQDAAEIGFRDDDFYALLKNNISGGIFMEECRPAAVHAMREWKKELNKMY